MTAHVAADLEDSRLSAWIPPAGSADSDLLGELKTITSRARDLARNHPVAAGARQTFNDNIVGSQLRLSSQPKYRMLPGWKKERAAEWANSTEDQFATWADTTECDAARTQTLLGLTIQALAGAMVNGDALALPVWQPRAGAQWSTRLQMAEADRLATPPWLQTDDSVRGGVKIDKYGAPLGYWIAKKHPGDKFGGYLSPDRSNWSYVPAFTEWGRRRVIHLFDKERSGQSRGKSVFTAVMREFRISGEYLGAELQAAASNALIAAIFESDLPPEVVYEILGQHPDGSLAYYNDVAKKKHRTKMEGGMNLVAPLGTKVTGFNPNRPNSAFDGFMESVMRHLAAGLNIPYELLFKDFSKTNYSSARAALLEAWRYFQSRRRWLKEHWLDPIYQIWLEEAINLERVDAPKYYENQFAYSRCRWVFSGRGWVDPQKEMNAVVLRIQNGLSSLEEECAEQGKDWEDVLDQRAREERKMRELGLSIPDVFAKGMAADTSTDKAVDDEKDDENA